MVIVANTRKVPIRDNEYLKLGDADGALEAKPVKTKGPGAYQFGPAANAASELKAWKEGIHQDFAEIERAGVQANYICMPEFGFPFGLRHKDSIDIPESADAQWRLLRSERLGADQFVCLGSSHRGYRRAKNSNDMQYENIAVVYPHGSRMSLDPNVVFDRKLASLPQTSQPDGVVLSKKLGGGITVTFTDEKLSASVRADLYAAERKKVDEVKLEFAGKAFDFFDWTAKPSSPPVYIQKKSPARKLGEYIDCDGELNLDVFVTAQGVIAVLICYDAFDPSIFLSAVRMYYESLVKEGDFFHHGIDIFFIPAFNRSKKFVEMCKVLSRETNSVVVYVSGDDRCRTKSNVFVCGQECDVWAKTMTGDKPHTQFFKSEPIPGHKHLQVYTIDKEVIDAAMRSMKTFASPSIRRSFILQSRSLGADVLG